MASLDSIMQPWDSAAPIPCVREVGRVVSTLQGEFKNIASGGSLLTSCTPQLHEKILDLINGRKSS